MRRASALVRFVARAPARVQIKLLAAFLAIEVLLIVMGAVGLHVLSGVNQRTDELIRLQRKIEAYRQVQHDTTNQLYSVSSVLWSADDVSLASTLRQLNQFGYNVDRLQFVAKDEIDLLDRFRQDYDQFTSIVRQTNGHFNLTWSSVGGTRYRLQYGGTNSGAGLPLSDLVRPLSEEIDSSSYGSASTQSFIDDFTLTGGAPTNGARFYRIKVVP